LRKCGVALRCGRRQSSRVIATIRECSVTMSNNLAGDLLWGAAAVGREIGVDEKRAFYLLGNRLIPGRKIGKIWVASRGELRAALCGADATNDAEQSEQEDGSADLAPPRRGRPPNHRP
jgi:hypothetical protein